VHRQVHRGEEIVRETRGRSGPCLTSPLARSDRSKGFLSCRSKTRGRPWWGDVGIGWSFDAEPIARPEIEVQPNQMTATTDIRGPRAGEATSATLMPGARLATSEPIYPQRQTQCDGYSTSARVSYA
jgi:hypothetical protein